MNRYADTLLHDGAESIPQHPSRESCPVVLQPADRRGHCGPRSTIEAYAAGRIELKKPSEDTPKGKLRYAPSFVFEGPDTYRDRPYTSVSIGKFIGWIEPSGGPNPDYA